MRKKDFPAETMGMILSQPCTLPFSLASAQSANQELPVPLPLRGGVSHRWRRVAEDSQCTAGDESCEPSTHPKQQVC